MIEDALTLLPGYPPERIAEYAPLAFWQADLPFNPGAPISGRPVEAHVNHGRWLVECECGGAQRTARTDPRFMCNCCGNVADGGAWRPVRWPKNADSIAAELSKRSHHENRNWRRGETVASLAAELRMMGGR